MKSGPGRGIFGAGPLLLTAAYPFVIYFLVDRGGLRLAGLALLAVLVAKYLLPGDRNARGLAALVAGAGFAVCIVLTNSETLARLYPVGLSVTMLSAFGFTLVQPPSMVERIARATGASLNEDGVRYTRKVTLVWCAFFIFNACVALATALAGSREAWAIYNGFLSYILAGALFVGERIVRPEFDRGLAGTTGP